MRDDRERLLDILQAIKLLEKNLPHGKALHELDELTFMGVVRCLEILGEASRYISDELKNKFFEVPWRQVSNMRNILAHQYFKVDVEKVENAIKKDIPELKVKIERVLKEFK